MLKIKLKLTVFLLFPLISFAQSVVPETFLIKTDTVAEFKLESKYWRVWDDSAGNTEFKTVSSAAFEKRFRQFDTAQQFDFSVKTFWYKLKLKNTLNKPLEIGMNWWGFFFDVYYTDSTLAWQHLKSGGGYPVSARDGYKLLNTIGFTIQPGQEVLVIVRQNNSFRYSIPKTFSIQLMETALRKKYNLKNTFSPTSSFEFIVNAFLLGLILITCVFNLTFYRAIKENEYLYFSLFLLFFGLGLFLSFYSDLFFGVNNYLIQAFELFVLAVWFFLLMLFIQSFFRTKLYLPKWHKFLTFYNYVGVVAWAFDFYLTQAKMSKYWFDRLIDTNNFFIYFFLDILFITVFLLLFNKKVKINIRLLATIPFFFFFGPVLSIQWYYQLAEKYFKVKQPAFVQWVNDWSSLLTLIGVLWMILFFSWLLFKRYESLQQKLVEEEIEKEKLAREQEEERNRIISQQKNLLEQQVTERTKELQQSIENLKATQKQLIQSEKMASLGELTAGIAHEIQNPLNFVNNFSEVCNELIDELKIKNEKLKIEDEEVKDLLGDLSSNLQKINHHGKRADAIVKGMLQHSRTSSGQKEPTDINALCDEYLRLSYHGLRAKDKSFNAKFETDLDASIGKINIQPQEMGRVILNLINNAFYAVQQKQKVEERKQDIADKYEPTVSISTKNEVDKITISIKDNGIGIPQKVLDKIFQPFFTTKPTGEGTGLGLSLSYDIITKGHSGELKVETKDGEGTTFIIILPK